MAQYSEGQKVKATRTIQRSAGAAWSGQSGKITKVTGDGYTIRWDNGGWEAESIKDSEIERA